MRFYQAHIKGEFLEYRDTAEEAFRDLKNRFYEVCAMRGMGPNNSYPLYDPNRDIGIAIVDV